MVNFNFIQQPLLRVNSFLLTPQPLLLIPPETGLLSLIVFLPQLTVLQIAHDVIAVLAIVDLAFGHETGLHGLHVFGVATALGLPRVLL